MPLYRVYGVLKSDGSEVIEEVVSPSRSEAEAHVNRRDVLIERIELVEEEVIADAVSTSKAQPAWQAGHDGEEKSATAVIDYNSGKRDEAILLASKARKLIGRGRKLWHWVICVLFILAVLISINISIGFYLEFRRLSQFYAIFISVGFLVISAAFFAFLYVLDCILIGIFMYFESRCVQIIKGEM